LEGELRIKVIYTTVNNRFRVRRLAPTSEWPTLLLNHKDHQAHSLSHIRPFPTTKAIVLSSWDALLAHAGPDRASLSPRQELVVEDNNPWAVSLHLPSATAMGRERKQIYEESVQRAKALATRSSDAARGMLTWGLLLASCCVLLVLILGFVVVVKVW
jgi:hypothetical protein